MNQTVRNMFLFFENKKHWWSFILHSHHFFVRMFVTSIMRMSRANKKKRKHFWVKTKWPWSWWFFSFCSWSHLLISSRSCRLLLLVNSSFCWTFSAFSLSISAVSFWLDSFNSVKQTAYYNMHTAIILYYRGKVHRWCTHVLSMVGFMFVVSWFHRPATDWPKM